MRYLLHWFGFIGFVGVLCAQATPRITSDASLFNFGEQSNTLQIEHTFTVRNTGSSLLKIGHVRSSCGCTVGAVSSRHVEPGETADITAVYNLRGRSGAQQSVLTLETNDPEQPLFRLTLIGYALRSLQVQPSRIFFGQVQGGAVKTQRVDIQGNLTQPFDVGTVHVASSHFAVEEIQQVAPHHYRLTVQLRAPDGGGHVQDEVRVQTTHPEWPEILIPLYADVAGALVVAPSSLTLVMDTERSVTRYVVVRPGSVQDFEVRDVEVPIDGVEVQVVKMGQQGYRIQLRNLRADASLEGQSVVVHTSAAAMPVIRIPFELITP